MKKLFLPLIALLVATASLPLVLFAGNEGFVLAAISPSKQKISCIRSYESTLLAALKNNGFNPKQDDTGFIYSLIGHDGPVSSDPAAQQHFWGLWQGDNVNSKLTFADFGPASIAPQAGQVYLFSFGKGVTPKLPTAATSICDPKPAQQKSEPEPSLGTTQGGGSFTYLLNNYADASKAEQDWAAMALGANGKLVNVSNTSSSAVTSIARVALAKQAQGQSIANETAKLKNAFDGQQFGDKNLVNDDIFAALAIAGSDKAWLSKHPQALTFIAESQRANGSFGYAVSGSGDVDMTAAALWALRLSSGYQSVKTAAKGYLLSAQNNDGGFGYQADQPSNVPSSAWATIGLRAIGSDVSKAVRYLNKTRQSDGSWKFGQTKSFLATSYAVLALSGKLLPISSVETGVSPSPTPTTEKTSDQNPSTTRSKKVYYRAVTIHGCTATASASASASAGNGYASASASATAVTSCW